MEKKDVNATLKPQFGSTSFHSRLRSAEEIMASVTEADFAAIDAMTISEFHPYNLALADSILNGTWSGSWDRSGSPVEWAVDLKRRWNNGKSEA